MKILLTEHTQVEISACLHEVPGNPLLIDQTSFSRIKEDSVRLFKSERDKKIHPFLLQRKNEQVFRLQANYYIGVDWLVPGVRFVQVEPKINKRLPVAFGRATDASDAEESEATQKTEEVNPFPGADYAEVDYLHILLDIVSAGLPGGYLDELILIDWQAPRIPVTQKEDRLTPFLVVQFLQLLKTIVRKGLKRSYYKLRENLQNRIKGKILVGTHIKQNVLKNRPAQTHCEYQIFGEDNIENRFLKKVLRFAASYVENNKSCFAGNLVAVQNLVSYCRPAFEKIGHELNEDRLSQVRSSPFFKEYKEAIAVGKHLLRKFAYNITETATLQKSTPPFWIDMPRLFELYCYVQLLKANPEDKHHIHYQFKTYGNMLDLLISKPGCEMVIDAKYKLHYQHGHLHQDIRQVAGYARLEKVRKLLKMTDDKHIDCLIIYPDINTKVIKFDYSFTHLQEQMQVSPIKAYYKVYKLGVSLPLSKSNCDLNVLRSNCSENQNL